MNCSTCVSSALHSPFHPHPPLPQPSHLSPITHRHNNTSQTNIRTQPLPHTRRFPNRRYPILLLVPVEGARESRVCVGRRADCEKDYEEEGLEVEECGLG